MPAPESCGPRTLSPAELGEFELLGLTRGHWDCLAAAPLFRPDLRTPDHRDFPILHVVRSCLPCLPHLITEAEGFWWRLANKLPDDQLEAVYALLGWHLATDRSRVERETYLARLRQTTAHFERNTTTTMGSVVVLSVRRWIEAFLPLSTYCRTPASIRLDPPDPVAVAQLLGCEIWRLLLPVPIAVALTDAGMSPRDPVAVVRRVAPFAERALFTQPQQSGLPLRPVSLALLGHPFDLDQLSIGAPQQEAFQLVVQGLAALGFDERAGLLDEYRCLIQQAIVGEAGTRLGTELVDRIRSRVEELLWQVRTPRNGAAPCPSHPSNCAVEEARIVTASVQPGAAQPRPAVSVMQAEAFTTLPLKDALAAAAQVQVGHVRAWLADPQNTSRMLFDEWRTECSQVAVVRDSSAVPPNLWIVGDLHADVLTLANLVAHAERQTPPGDPPPAFVFLGDFIDRGSHDHETLLYLFGLIMKSPERICVLPGNHDVDLQWRDRPGQFAVTIEPAEYCERLNRLLFTSLPGESDQIELARLSIPFWQSRPKAVVLPDGTLLAHGGFPHTDTHGLLRSVADLGRKECVNDFLWARVSDGPRKRPNRGNRGHEFGSSDFAQFCRKSGELGLPPVKRFVRGHDHVPQRWQYLTEYSEFPVLTINSMGRWLEGELRTEPGVGPLPVVARYVAHQLPDVIRLPLDPDEVGLAFPRLNRDNNAGPGSTRYESEELDDGPAHRETGHPDEDAAGGVR